MFYNFSGKDDLIAAYLAGRDQRRRDRIAKFQHGLDDPPAHKLLAIFEALGGGRCRAGLQRLPVCQRKCRSPPPGSVESAALRTFRDWMANAMLSLCEDAGYAHPGGDVSARLCLLYDGAVAGSNLDAQPQAVGIAKELASMVLETAPRR